MKRALGGLIFSSVYKTWPLSTIGQLEDYGDVILASAAVSHGVFLGGMLLSLLYNKHYRALDSGKKASWGIHIVSFVFSSVILLTALSLEEGSDKILGTNPYSSLVVAISAGYFLWDFFISVYYVQQTGPEFIFHATSCFFVFLLALKPFAQGYVKLFLFFEVSTIFLNIHWFCDKTGRSGSTLQWVNGMCLLAAFFTFRLVLGTLGMAEFISKMFFLTLAVEAHSRSKELETELWKFYSVAACGLGLLNFYWFHFMIRSVFSRFKEGKNVTKSKTT